MDFEIPFFFYHQGSRLATLSIELVRPVRNLGTVLTELEGAGVAVLGLTSWMPTDGSDNVGFLMVLDLTGHAGDPNDLARRLSELPEVADVRIWPSEIEGLATMTPKGFVTFLGERVYVMPSVVFRAIYHALYKTHGKTVFVILYLAGKAAGERAAEIRGLLVDPDEGPLGSLVAIMKVLGPPLGVLRDIELLEAEGGSPTLLVEELADCVVLREMNPRMPTGHFLRGFIEGFMRSLGEPVEAYETRCLNLGHPHCAFELRRGDSGSKSGAAERRR